MNRELRSRTISILLNLKLSLKNKIRLKMLLGQEIVLHSGR